MIIQTFSPAKYRQKIIYIRRMETTFEYLVSIDGEIYTHNIELNPQIYARVLNFLGFMKDLYTQKQIQTARKLLENVAQKTIDTILSTKK